MGKKLVLFTMLSVVALSFLACGKRKEIAVFTYEITESETVVITGLTDKGKNDSELTIPSKIEGKKVTTINAGAFRDNSLITKVTISDGIENISENTFLNCYNLKEIIIPESVVQVGTNAFTNTFWANDIFANSKELRVNNILCQVRDVSGSYSVPDGIVTIASGVFYGNSNVKDIVMPDSVKNVGAYAFAKCEKLENVKVSANLESIGYGAFLESGIKELQIPSSVKTIGNEAFLGIDNVKYKGNATGKPWGAKNIE